MSSNLHEVGGAFGMCVHGWASRSGPKNWFAAGSPPSAHQCRSKESTGRTRAKRQLFRGQWKRASLMGLKKGRRSGSLHLFHADVAGFWVCPSLAQVGQGIVKRVERLIKERGRAIGSTTLSFPVNPAQAWREGKELHLALGETQSL